MKHKIRYTLLFLSSSLYAAILSTKKGEKIAQKFTTISVVIGVGVTITSMPAGLRKPAFLHFLVSGTPFLIRGVVHTIIERQ